MKVIKYNFCTRVNHGMEENPQFEDILFPVTLGWNEVNEETAKREAYNGEYEIVEVEDPVTEPTQAERFEAQLTYTAMMTNTLLPEEE